MTIGSKICPSCHGLNSKDAERCARCDEAFPHAFTQAFRALSGSLGSEFPLTLLVMILHTLVFAGVVLTSKRFDVFAGYALIGGAFEQTSGLPLSVQMRWGAMIPGLNQVEPWRIVSATFFHYGALHICFNMFALIDLGKMLEPRLGWARFALLFMVCSVLGFLTSYLWQESDWGARVTTGGASAGVLGLGGGVVGYLYAKKDDSWKQVLTRFGFYAVVLAIMMPVNNAAHAGGFVAGAVLGYLFGRESRPARKNRLFAVLAAGLLTGFLASLVLCQVSDQWRLAHALERGLAR